MPLSDESGADILSAPDGSAVSSDEEPASPTSAKLLRLEAAASIPILLAAFGVAYFFTIDHILAEQLTNNSAAAFENGESSVDSVNFSIFGPKLEINNFQVWQNTDNGQHKIVDIGRANLDIELVPLFSGRIVVNEALLAKTTLQTPLSKEQPEDESLPDKTGSDQLSEYLKKAQDLINSDEVKDLREWLDKLKEYQDENSEEDEPETKGKGGKGKSAPADTSDDPGIPRQAWYIAEREKQVGATPRVVIKKAAIEELNIVLGQGEDRFVRSLTNVNLEVQSVSSAPVAYGQPIKVTASGELDGDKTRTLKLGGVVQFDADQLIKLKQVDAGIELAQINIAGLADEAVFGKLMKNAKLTITNYASSHETFAGRTSIAIVGDIFPEGTQKARAGLNLWFGGLDGDAGMVPTGIGFHLQKFPLTKILALSGGTPLSVEDNGALITIGTCDAEGNFDTPEAAIHWADGLGVNIRLKVDSLKFSASGGDVAGLPGGLVVRGLNNVITEMGGLDIIVGFSGKPEDVSLSLIKPGVRSFVDAVVNSLDASSADIKAVIDLPFNVSDNAKLSFTSVNADGSKRDPKLSISGSARHDLNDLRVSINFKNLLASPKPGQNSIAGLPAADFCAAFNKLVSAEDGLSIRTRIMDDTGKFSPALESPGLRGITDAMIALFGYTGAQINQRYDLPVLIADNADLILKSINDDGSIRGLSSNGADSDSLANLRIATLGTGLTIRPKTGHSKVMGLPSVEFCDMFNRFAKSQKDGLTLDWRVFDKQSEFAPSLLKPGRRGLVDAMLYGREYSGAELNKFFSDVPFQFVPDANARILSIGSDGSESNSLGDLLISVTLKNGFVAPKKGVTNIYGIPAQHFTFAWNKLQDAYRAQGFPMTLRLTDGTGNFKPAMQSPTEGQLIKQLGQTTGIANFKTGFRALSKKFGVEFGEFEKGGLGAAEKIAKGDWNPLNSQF
ncbi:MAG: hypothetical protein L3J82_06795 [Planctomycetes bacterium]|nr:hypothetical protein [Planctomycetota bacterium]